MPTVTPPAPTSASAVPAATDVATPELTRAPTHTSPSVPAAVATTSASALAAATPAHRDRYIDLLRAVSIGVVVFGHWLIAAVDHRQGRLTGDNVLALIPATQWLTWVLQVMPLFFLVGGYANSASWSAARRDGLGYGGWLHARLARLLPPSVVFVGVWTAVAAVAAVAGVDPSALRLGAHVVAVPLWFLAVYVGVVALAPLACAAHRRYGLTAAVALTVAAVVVDVADLVLGVPGIGSANFLFVWLAVHQFGICWRDGTLGRRHAPWLMLGGLMALVLLTTVGPYARSMVGVPGEVRTNNSPPTVPLIALGLWQLGVAAVARERVNGWLQRPRVWTAVVAANGVAMTVYLWHLTAVAVVAITVLPAGLLRQPPVGTGAWWAMRAPWLLTLTVVLLPLIALFARHERPGARTRPTVAGPAAASATALGVAVVCLGLATFTLHGFHVAGQPLGLPLPALLALAGGLTLLRVGLRPSTVPGRRQLADLPLASARPCEERPCRS
ncbi:MAG TPA: acyltransferase [Nitriliruptorales bacterium]|nr:acyltransferase [Nitriliruptorales bacterium]